MTLDPAAAEVLAFWFGPAPYAERKEWFRKDAAFDATIRERFGALIARALAGGLGDWCVAPHGSLARVIVLDQFTRNAFRDTAEAFAGDARALATAQDALDRGFDRTLAPLERWFLYMPFEHSESLAMQDRAIALFAALADEGLPGPLDWARRHRDVIARFGRFPHRNVMLGRASTAEELAFLRQPGSSF
ncbi:MAG: DUF924 domain-containing protein [Proteobacteria bacterium]|nr:DUF924 domain-containing protein [Pseudomonadota bacterium]